MKDFELENVLGRENQYIFQKQKDLPVRFLNATFGKLLEFTKLTEARAVQGRTLFSLQNIYPTQALLGGTDIHTLAKQMGNNILILEQHYSKLTATLASERLA